MRCALLLVAAVVVAGCGSNASTSYDTTQPTTTSAPTTTTSPETTSLLIYLVDPDDGKLSVADRSVPKTQAVARAALEALAEANDSQVPAGLSVAIAIANGEASVSGAELSPAAEAQVVYTLTQFPSVTSVNGKTRPDVEDFVPAILVEHPTPGATVSSPLRVTGNANTFEATFQYELRDADGKVLAKHFVTATSGTGMRGTFDFSVRFTVGDAQDGALVVYENSAENGAVIHKRTIPLRLAP